MDEDYDFENWDDWYYHMHAEAEAWAVDHPEDFERLIREIDESCGPVEK
jgi:hypothetical protein